MQLLQFNYPTVLNTAVLFLVFNRLEVTKETFNAIREARPTRLYIAADGPRHLRKEEKKINEVKNFILSNIDWDCEVKTLFREENLGAPIAVSSAISWFFETEDNGIILEDDCVPGKSFFSFCEQLLEKYQDDFSVGMVSGNNFQNGIKRGKEDYFFTIYGHIWGWATWANRWKNHDMKFQQNNTNEFIEKIFEDNKAIRYWKNIYNTKKNWDYLWILALWKNKQLSICPKVNLVSNIGFGEDATNTFYVDKRMADLEIMELDLTKHPSKVEVNDEADKYTSRNIFNIRSVTQILINKISRKFLDINIFS